MILLIPIWMVFSILIPKPLSGMVFGWIDDPINFIVEVLSGKGKIILTTLPLIRNLFASPTMLALFNQILKKL